MTNVIDQPKRWPRLVSVVDAAEYLSISPNTVRGLDIPTRSIGRRVLYDVRDLDRFVDRMSDLPEAGAPPADAAAEAAEVERKFFEKRQQRRAAN